MNNHPLASEAADIHTVTRLLHDPFPSVWKAAAQNTPLETRQRLAQDENRFVRAAARAQVADR